VPVAVAGVAAAHHGPLAIARAAGWDQEVLAAHGCWVSPRTGERVPAPMPDRLGKLVDPDESGAALTAAVAAVALDPAVRGDPRHVPARQGVAAGGKERKGAQAGGGKKARFPAAVTHVPGIVIAQDRAAEAGKANEISHVRPLLAPLPLAGAVITADAMQADRDSSFTRKVKEARYLRPIPGSQPDLNAQLNAPDRGSIPVAAAASQISRGRIGTRAIRALPAPEGTGFCDAKQALLLGRYVTYRNKGQWRTRAEPVLCLTSLAAGETTPQDLLARVRGHWQAECAHWRRDVIWKEDKSLIRTGNGPQAWSALANLVITLFRIHGVTSFTEETRRIAQDPRRALDYLNLPCPSPG
jgi:predicted transposase YbfD/YdcC